ncbi:hypothetical protein RYX45_13900 [Alkalihalophilus pseudofirmus]|uniref:Uncharacterized protein n=1 Tax=Alkalihalophilus pseudofirmus TaxID=79885 RepID=A0AAJ2NPV4_ALKPS|nr:hypothetical protein [Alkalihalophilus pseudofirmus]MDV2886278.1 hypothetical protein [Alkalihalophilus pseudofirmus]
MTNLEFKLLRHITKKEFLPSIISSGALLGEFVQRKGDNNYISFEANPTDDTLVRNFHIIKNWEESEVFELIFNGENLVRDGFNICSTIDGKRFSKIEIDLEMQAKGKDNIAHLVGDYAFIKGLVPLRYLTDISKQVVKQWASQNDINEFDIQRALYN